MKVFTKFILRNFRSFDIGIIKINDVYIADIPKSGSSTLKHIAALKDYKWALAGAEARNSRWYSQVGDRAERLCQRLEAL